MRKLHRWVSVAALLFAFWIIITGLLLAVDYLWPVPGGKPGWWNDGAPGIRLHNLLQELHRGMILFGVPGHVILFLTGISLAFLSISGLQMYLKMLGRQRKAGRRGLFWKAGTGMRRYHRWLGTIGIVFIAYVVLTGTVVSFVQFLDPAAVAPIVAAEGGPDGRPAGPAEPSSPIVALSTELQKWHKGNIAGKPGQWIVLVTGLAFLIMAITGTFTYLQMWRARRKLGKRDMFWS